MKKVMTFVLCAVLGSFALTGCSESSEPFAQKEYTAEGEQIREIHIDVRDRKITVSPSEDSLVHIGYSENNKEYYDISVSEDQVLTMTAESDKEWTDFIGTKPAAEDREIALQIPDALLAYLKLSTTNEDIILENLQVKENISLDSNGGNIIFEKADVGNTLELTAKNGNISGTVAGSYDDFAISSAIKKGESNLPENKDGGEKTLQVSCNNGDISVDFQN